MSHNSGTLSLLGLTILLAQIPSCEAFETWYIYLISPIVFVILFVMGICCFFYRRHVVKKMMRNGELQGGMGVPQGGYPQPQSGALTVSYAAGQAPYPQQAPTTIFAPGTAPYPQQSYPTYPPPAATDPQGPPAYSEAVKNEQTGSSNPEQKPAQQSQL